MKTNNAERGQVLAWLVILLPMLLALVGLAFDGGLMWMQYRRARWAADGAAVAAAQTIDQAAFLASGRVVLGQGALEAAAEYVAYNDPALHVTDIFVQDNVVHVRAWVEVSPVFLGLVGARPVRLSVYGRERPAWGIEEEER